MLCVVYCTQSSILPASFAYLASLFNPLEGATQTSNLIKKVEKFGTYLLWYQWINKFYEGKY